LSLAAILYYALRLMELLLERAAEIWRGRRAFLGTELTALIAVFLVWMFLRRIRTGIIRAHD